MIQKSISYIVKYVKERVRTSITAIPLLIVVSLLFKDYDKEITEVIGESLIPIKSYFLFACQLCAVLINHIISIKFEEYVLGKKEFSCAVSRLLWKNEIMNEQMKKAIHTCVRVQFGIKMLPKDEEFMDEKAARSAIAYAVSQIANSLQDCKVVQYYKNEYVAARKLIGGCISANIVSLVLCIYAKCTGQLSLLHVSGVLLGIYIILLAVNLFLIKWFGRMYTNKLFEQYVYGASVKFREIKGEKA